MIGLIVEGVAGVGKSSLLKKLANDTRLTSSKGPALFIPEEETLGELYAHILAGNVRHSDEVERLESVLDRVHSSSSEFVVLERFHYSYYALGIDWALLQRFDEILAQLRFKTVLLDLEDSLLESRSFHRPEFAEDKWQQWFVCQYGSKEKAVTAFKESQSRRREALKLSRLPHLVINTGAKDWGKYANEAISFLETE